MRNRSNTVWFVVIGVLVVALVGALAFAFWPEGETEDPPPSGPTSTTSSPTERTSEPSDPPSSEPEPSPSTENGGIDPSHYGGHPPSEVVEELFPYTDGLSGTVPLPPELNGWQRDTSMGGQGPSSAESIYDKDGVSIAFSVHLARGHFARRMDQIVNHRQIGISVCGEASPEFGWSLCAAASRDADLIVRAYQPEKVSLEEMAALLEAAVEFYRAERG